MKYLNLVQLRPGQTARIVEIQGGLHLMRRLEAMGLRIGAQISSLGDQVLHGPVIIRSGGTQVAIGQGMARKIIVEPTG